MYPYLALTGEKWSDFVEFFDEKWSLYTLYSETVWYCLCFCVRDEVSYGVFFWSSYIKRKLSIWKPACFHVYHITVASETHEANCSLKPPPEHMWLATSVSSLFRANLQCLTKQKARQLSRASLLSQKRVVIGTYAIQKVSSLLKIGLTFGKEDLTYHGTSYMFLGHKTWVTLWNTHRSGPAFKSELPFCTRW